MKLTRDYIMYSQTLINFTFYNLLVVVCGKRYPVVLSPIICSGLTNTEAFCNSVDRHRMYYSDTFNNKTIKIEFDSMLDSTINLTNLTNVDTIYVMILS